RPLVGDDVQLAVLVLAEGGDLGQLPVGVQGGLPVPVVGGLAVLDAEAAQEGGAVVAVEIGAGDLREGPAAVGVAAGDRAALAVGVLEDRLGEAGAVAGGGVEAVLPLGDVPAEVVEGVDLGGRQKVDVLEDVLPDVG